MSRAAPATRTRRASSSATACASSGSPTAHGDQTILFLPTWTLVHSRIWKAQIPYFARHFRVVCFDPRGNGRSDRPQEPSAYAETEFAQDAIDVMDACGVDRAMCVALSTGAQRGLLLAAEHPERVAGMVFIGPWFPVSRLRSLRWRVLAHPRMYGLSRKQATAHDARLGQVQPALLDARRLRRLRPVVGGEDAARAALDEADRGRDRVVARHRRPDARSSVSSAKRAAPADTARPDRARASASGARCSSSTAPKDEITPYADGKALAKITGGRLETVEGAGHLPHARKPVQVNLALREFVDGTPRRDPTVHRSDGRKRALYISSPIGLGHAQRDVAIARELRSLVDGLEIDWLAQDPVTRVLEAEGERIHPGSEHLANESRHIESESAEHDLHCFQAIAPDGRDPDQQLHGLPRHRARGPLRPLDRRRGVGARLLPAREPAREAGALRLADRLRRLAADARRRRARGVPHRRLQRRDGRAHRRAPRRCATGRSSSATPTTSSTSGSARSCR